MQSLYTKYGVQTTDPSAGLMAAQTNQKANLKDVLTGIEGLMKNQENQIIQRNTLGLQDQLKQRIQQKGLGILSEPLDTDLITKPFGNMVDKAVIGKTLTDQVDLLKNKHINTYSAEADNILATTGDPIAAREHLKKQLIAAGAPSTFGDVEANNYDLRKAAEIKNIATRKAEAITLGSADIEQIATTQGYDAAQKAKNTFISSLPKKDQPAARKQMDGHLTELSTPDKFDLDQIDFELSNFRKETTDTTKAMEASLEQQNAANRQVLSNSQSTNGGKHSSSGKNKGKGSTPALVDKDGLPIVDVVESWRKRVTNPVEGWDSKNDGQILHNTYNSIFDLVKDKSAADNIFDTAVRSKYKGDGVFGNNFTKQELKDVGTLAKQLAAEHLGSQEDDGSGTGSSSSSSRLAGKFTDAKPITDYISQRAKLEAKLRSELITLARDKKLRGNNPADPTTAIGPDAIQLKAREIREKYTPTPSVIAAPAPASKPAVGKSSTGKRTSGKTDTVANPVSRREVTPEWSASVDAATGKNKPAAGSKAETKEQKVERIARELQAAEDKTAKAKPAAAAAPSPAANTPAKPKYSRGMSHDDFLKAKQAEKDSDPEDFYTKNKYGNPLLDWRGRPKPLKMKASEAKKAGLSK